MPYCPICEKCLYSTGRKTGSDRKYQLGSNLRRHKALKASGVQGGKEGDDTKGIISTKCGHLYHQSCLRDYITNFRTKGDCYGTTYNVLCPLCGANLSNGKMLRIDLEAHFGILEEFFQDLCKLKYMNKELKRTVELEWADIAELEKKMVETKAEYEHVRTIKRNNEQKCTETEARISKAIDDARTCYRYREIEKQLIDENVNLEAVARRMETIISTRVRTPSPPLPQPTTSVQSTALEIEDQDNELFPYQNPSPPQTNEILYPHLQDNNNNNNQQILSIVDKSYPYTSDSDDNQSRGQSDLDHSDQVKSSCGSSQVKERARRQVDISVQISVHSEWSVDPSSPPGKVKGHSSKFKYSRASNKKRIQQQQSHSFLCNSNSSIYSMDSVNPPVGQIEGQTVPNTGQLCQLENYHKEQIARSRQETVTLAKYEPREDQRKLSKEIEANLTSGQIDRSKSYIIQTHCIVRRKGSQKITYIQDYPEICSQDNLENTVENQNHLVTADKSRSYTIQTFVTTETVADSSGGDILWPLENFPSDESIDPLLRSLLYPQDKNDKQGQRSKLKKPGIIVSSSQKARQEIKIEQQQQKNKSQIQTTTKQQNNSSTKIVSKKENSIKNAAASKHLQFLPGKCGPGKEFSKNCPSLALVKYTPSTTTATMGKYSNRNEMKRVEEMEDLSLVPSSSAIVPYNNSNTSLSLTYSVDNSSSCSSSDHQLLNYSNTSIENRDNEMSEGLLISPPQMFASENPVHCLALSFPPLPPIPTPRKVDNKSPVSTRKEDSPDLKLPPPPNNNDWSQFILPPPPVTNFDVQQLSLVLPPPPMTPHGNPGQKQVKSCLHRCETPESTRKLLESLLTKSCDTPRQNVQNNSKIPPPPPLPPMENNDFDDDELLKSVIFKANSSVTIESLDQNQNPSITGGGDEIKCNNRQQLHQQLEEDRLIQYMISNQDIPSLHHSISSNSKNNGGKDQNVKYSLATDHFVKYQNYQPPISNFPLLYNSTQSVRVGVEPADDHRDGYLEQNSILDNQYLYSRVAPPPPPISHRSMNLNVPDYPHPSQPRADIYGNDSRDNFYSYFPCNGWAGGHKMTVTTPIVIEHKNSPPNVVHGCDLSFPRDSLCSNNYYSWMPESHASLSPSSHHPNPVNNPNFLTNPRNFP